MSLERHPILRWLAIVAVALGAFAVAVPRSTWAAAPTTASAHGYDDPTQHAVSGQPWPNIPPVEAFPRDRHPSAIGVDCAVLVAGVAAEGGGTELVQRAMSRAELQATEDSGLIRGGREGTNYVSDNVNSNALRARQRLALPQTPEVRVTLKVPSGAFSPPKLVDPLYDMPGGGMERMGTGQIACRVVAVLDYC